MKGAPSHRPSAKRAVVVCLDSLFLTVSLLMLLVRPSTTDLPYLLLACTIAVLCAATHFAAPPASGGSQNRLTPDTVFIVSFLLQHYPLPLRIIFGDVSPMNTRVSPAAVSCGTMLATAGLAAFCLGFQVLSDAPATSPRAMSRAPWCRHDRSWLRWAYGALAVFVVLTIVHAAVDGIAWLHQRYAGNGGSSYQADLLYFLVLLTGRFSLAALAAVAFADARHGASRLVVLVSVGVALLWFFLIGDRGEGLALALAATCVFFERVRPLKLRHVLALALGGLFVLQIGGLARTYSDRSVSTFVTVLENNRDKIGFKDTTTALNCDVDPLYAAVDIVPQRHDYFWGRWVFGGLLTFVPFASKVIPLPVLGSSSADYLTEVIFRGDRRVGAGTSPVAEAYMDFGVPGVVLVLAFVGVLMRGVLRRARSGGSVVWQIGLANLLAVALLLPRASATALVRGLAWPLLFAVIVSWFTREQ